MGTQQPSKRRITTIDRLMTIPDYLPTICDWCGSHDAGVENPHHPKHGRFLFAFCNDCDWIREYDRDEEFKPDSEDLDPN
jgi:hypothetical protein